MSAQERVSHFVKMWDAKPLKGLAENFYGIHIGTEWEAGLTIDDLRAVTALNAELLEALEAAKKEMLELNEPCDHSVGVCWCEYHRVLDKVISAIDKARN